MAENGARMRRTQRITLIAVAAVLVLAGGVFALTHAWGEDADPQPLSATVEPSQWPQRTLTASYSRECVDLGQSTVGELIQSRSTDGVLSEGPSCKWTGDLAPSAGGVTASVELFYALRVEAYVEDEQAWREYLDSWVDPFAGCGANSVVPVVVDASQYPYKIGCVNEGGYVDGFVDGRMTTVAVANWEYAISVAFTVPAPDGDLDALGCCGRQTMLDATADIVERAVDALVSERP